MRRALLLLLLPALRIGVAAAQQYGLRTYSIEDGLPSSVVRALAEDADGYLWVGTDQGAARTDGRRMDAWTRRQGLPHDAVTALAADAKGRVWLGFANGSVAEWSAGRITTIHPGPGGSVRALVPRGEELWWATQGQGVQRIQQGRVRGFGMADGLGSDQVLALVADAQGRIVAGTDSGLYVLQGERWRPLPGVVLPHPRVQSLHADRSGLLVGTARGFLELDTALVPLPVDQRFLGAHPLALPESDVLCALRAANGDLWLGTPGGLIHLSRSGGHPTIKVMREDNGLGHDLVRCLLQDRSGAIWAGTGFGGVTKHTGDAFLHFTDRDGLGSRTVSALHRTPDGRLWLGTAGGGISLWDGSGLLHFGAAEGLTDPFVLALGEDAAGFLLAGTASQGLFRGDGRRFVPVPGVDARRIHAILLDAEGRSWLGTERGLLVDPGDGRYLRVEGCDLPVNGMACNGDTLWAATAQGLHLLPTRTMPWRMQPVYRLPQVAQTCITRDSRGNLWIGTESHGVQRLQGLRVDSVTVDEGLASNAVEQVLLDAVENLWVGTRQGVHLLELDELQERVLRIVHHGADDGFIGIECFRNACLLDADSALWFGTVRGATRHDPRLANAEEPGPIVHLTGLRLFFQETDWSPWSTGSDERGMPRDLRLPHDRNHLTFQFTGISLAFPERVRYQYYLEGLDQEWSPITASDHVTYSALPPGEYRFHVQARNASGVWSEPPITYAFTIEPAFWQTGAFRMTGGAGLVLGLIGFVRLRTRRLQRDRERLERTVQERTRELAAEKQRSDDLLRNILPAATAEELKAKGHADAQRHERVTVLFSDFKGFTSFSSRMDSDTLVGELQHFFGEFDALCDRFGVEKIKTIGDAYMCAAGLPRPSPTHALDALLMAFAMLDAVERSNAERRAKGLQEWPIRIGLHSGPVVAGVVGTRKFAYDIWGDTVNLASRMEANSDAGRINISGPVYAQVMDYIEAVPRGPIKVKGKGEVQMYFALRLRPEYSADARGWAPNGTLLNAIGRGA